MLVEPACGSYVSNSINRRALQISQTCDFFAHSSYGENLPNAASSSLGIDCAMLVLILPGYRLYERTFLEASFSARETEKSMLAVLVWP